MEPTEDPTVLIEERRTGYVRYVRSDGVRWEITGICVQCGECEVGGEPVYPLVWTGIPVGQPGACYREDGAGGVDRLDNPVTPEGVNEQWPHCSLEGGYL